MADDAALEGDLLVVLLDVAALVVRDDLISQVLAFVNAHAMFNKQNQLAVFAVQPDSSHLVYMSLGEESSSTTQSTVSVFPSTALHDALMKLSQLPPPKSGPNSGTALSGALSRALCLTHRLSKSASRLRVRNKARILCLVASPDVPMQYIPVMNAIFSAQRADTVIDAVVLCPQDSAFLQQASHITGGLYFKLKDCTALLQTLLNYLLCDTATRSLLEVSQALGVDFRASCFCHKNTIDIGYVCSVCLSIFCRPIKVCTTCSTHFGQLKASTGHTQRMS